MDDYFANDARTSRERMLAGDDYIDDDPQLLESARRAVRLSADYTHAYAHDLASARSILTNLFASVGHGVHIKPPFAVNFGFHISIGTDTFINSNFTALDVAPITIGRDVQIGSGVQLLTPSHPIDPRRRRDKLESAKPIVIEDNVWLCGGSIVLPGISIGENSIVGAGSVVTKDLGRNVLAVGNPARVIRQI